jgi:hypothetical protein
MWSKAIRNLIILVGLIAIGFFGWSCWKNNREAELARLVHKHELQVFGLTYHELIVFRRGPESLEEFLKLPGMDAYEKQNQKLVSQIRSGDLIVIWGATLFETAEENEKHILAYEKQTPEKGGWVIRGGGSAAYLSPKEYQSLSHLPNDIEPVPQEGEIPVWKRYRTLDGVFSAEYPAPPLPSHLEMEDVDIDRLTLRRHSKRGFYSLSRISSPLDSLKKAHDELLDQWRDNVMKLHRLEGSDPKLFSERAIEHDGVPGRQFEFQFLGTKRSFDRVFFLSGIGYRANVVIDIEKQDDKDVQRFLESIRFHKDKR